jgi:hypothetical protein
LSAASDRGNKPAKKLYSGPYKAPSYRRHRRWRRGGKAHELVHVKGSLRGVYPRSEPQDLRLIRAFAWWDRAVPERVARNARPVGQRKGTLLVNARSSAWVQELGFLEGELLESIHRCLGDQSIQRIRVRPGPLPPRLPRQPPPPKTLPLEATELPPEIARELAQIQDDGLRAALTRAATMSLSERTDQDEEAEVDPFYPYAK